MRLSVIALTFLISGGAIASDKLVVSISPIIEDGLPNKFQAIMEALYASGLNIEYRRLPSRRALISVSKGEIALDAYRTPSAVNMFPDLIRIDPAVDIQALWLVARDKKLCSASAEQLKQASVVGIRGARLYQTIYQDFAYHEMTNSFESVIEMLNKGHVDYSVIPLFAIQQAEQNLGVTANTCRDKPYITFAFHSYIHKDFAWAIPQLESSYHHYFSENE